MQCQFVHIENDNSIVLQLLCGVLQGYSLAPQLVMLYIRNISNIRVQIISTCATLKVKYKRSIQVDQINNALEKFHTLFAVNSVFLKIAKIKYMLEEFVFI